MLFLFPFCSNLLPNGSIAGTKLPAKSYSSNRGSKFYDLQLAIKSEFEQNNEYNDSIEKALFKYLCPEILEGENAY